MFNIEKKIILTYIKTANYGHLIPNSDGSELDFLLIYVNKYQIKQ